MSSCFFIFFFFFFFLMIRRPPRSTLFPSRRSSDLGSVHRPRPPATRPASSVWAGAPAATGPGPCPRSEEHTSELQSLAYLVCRLLLEKKKTKLKIKLYKKKKKNKQKKMH